MKNPLDKSSNNNTKFSSIATIVPMFCLIVLNHFGIPVGEFNLPKSHQQKYTLEEYEKIDLGMSLTDVNAILGPGTEITKFSNSATYIWKNDNNSKIIVNFTDGFVVKKEQTIQN